MSSWKQKEWARCIILLLFFAVFSFVAGFFLNLALQCRLEKEEPSRTIKSLLWANPCNVRIKGRKVTLVYGSGIFKAIQLIQKQSQNYKHKIQHFHRYYYQRLKIVAKLREFTRPRVQNPYNTPIKVAHTGFQHFYFDGLLLRIFIHYHLVLSGITEMPNHWWTSYECTCVDKLGYHSNNITRWKHS